MSETIEKLVKDARRGNGDAFAELVYRRKEMMYRTAYTYLKSEEDALDAVSTAVCKAFTSLRKLKEPAYFDTWFTRILINCCLDFLKKKERTLLVPWVGQLEGEMEDGTISLDLEQAVNRLDEKCRTVIVLKYFNDLTIREVARVMGCPQGTAKSYLHRALAKLRTELKEDWLNA